VSGQLGSANALLGIQWLALLPSFPRDTLLLGPRSPIPTDGSDHLSKATKCLLCPYCRSFFVAFFPDCCAALGLATA
jgi:hypothetical protein